MKSEVKPRNVTPEQLWRDHLIAQAQLEQHLLQAPTRLIKQLHKKVRVQIFTVRKP